MSTSPVTHTTGVVRLCKKQRMIFLSCSLEQKDKSPCYILQNLSHNSCCMDNRAFQVESSSIAFCLSTMEYVPLGTTHSLSNSRDLETIHKLLSVKSPPVASWNDCRLTCWLSEARDLFVWFKYANSRQSNC